MKTGIVAVIGVFAVAAIAIACSTFSAPGDRNMDTDIIIGIGEEYTIELDGNPTTGYEWSADAPAGLTVSSDYKQKDAPEGMVGVGGKYSFTVSSDSAGTYILKLSYERSWEGSPIEERTYVITVA